MIISSVTGRQTGNLPGSTIGLAVAKMVGGYARLVVLYDGDPPLEISWYERRYIRLASIPDAVMFRILGKYVPEKTGLHMPYPDELARAIKFYKNK